MKKYIIALSILFLSCGSYAQKKDSIPPMPKRYIFTLDTQGYNTVDSILRLSLQVCGYELKASQADGLRSGLSAVISFFQRERLQQDSIQQAMNKAKSR